MGKKFSPRHMQLAAWGISLSVTILTLLAWGESYSWKLSPLSMLKVFPLFGLLAFSLMWGHYIASAIRRYFKVDAGALRDYFEITSAVVLTAILLHPGLLVWQLWRSGFGLPPGSTKMYVGATAYWAIWLGILAWTLFLSYELRRVWGKKSWWRFVQYANDGAMFLIFIHALKLGGALKLGWFRGVWMFYGVTLIGVLLYAYWPKPKHS